MHFEDLKIKKNSWTDQKRVLNEHGDEVFKKFLRVILIPNYLIKFFISFCWN